MSLATEPIQNDIIARLQEQIPQLEVFDTEVPDEQKLPTSNGMLKSYAVVYFSEPVRAAVSRGIVSTRRDLHRAGMTVQVISPRSGDARMWADKIKDALTGYKPADASEMVLEGGAATNNGTGTTRPTTYSRYIAFSFYTNLITD